MNISETRFANDHRLTTNDYQHTKRLQYPREFPRAAEARV
jgi:hypothetical protein